jgi:hypothetical protein
LKEDVLSLQLIFLILKIFIERDFIEKELKAKKKFKIYF